MCARDRARARAAQLLQAVPAALGIMTRIAGHPPERQSRAQQRLLLGDVIGADRHRVAPAHAHGRVQERGQQTLRLETEPRGLAFARFDLEDRHGGGEETERARFVEHERRDADGRARGTRVDRVLHAGSVDGLLEVVAELRFRALHERRRVGDQTGRQFAGDVLREPERARAAVRIRGLAVQREHARQLERVRPGLGVDRAAFFFGQHFPAFDPEPPLTADLDLGARGLRAGRAATGHRRDVFLAAFGFRPDFHLDRHFDLFVRRQALFDDFFFFFGVFPFIFAERAFKRRGRAGDREPFAFIAARDSFDFFDCQTFGQLIGDRDVAAGGRVAEVLRRHHDLPLPAFGQNGRALARAQMPPRRGSFGGRDRRRRAAAHRREDRDRHPHRRDYPSHRPLLRLFWRVTYFFFPLCFFARAFFALCAVGQPVTAISVFCLNVAPFWPVNSVGISSDAGFVSLTLRMTVFLWPLTLTVTFFLTVTVLVSAHRLPLRGERGVGALGERQFEAAERAVGDRLERACS